MKIDWIWEKDGKEIESEIEFTITIEQPDYERGGSGGDPGGTYIDILSIIDGMSDSKYERIEEFINNTLRDYL